MHQTRRESIQPFAHSRRSTTSAMNDIGGHVSYGSFFRLTQPTQKVNDTVNDIVLLQYLNKCQQLSTM